VQAFAKAAPSAWVRQKPAKQIPWSQFAPQATPSTPSSATRTTMAVTLPLSTRPICRRLSWLPMNASLSTQKGSHGFALPSSLHSSLRHPRSPAHQTRIGSTQTSESGGSGRKAWHGNTHCTCSAYKTSKVQMRPKSQVSCSKSK